MRWNSHNMAFTANQKKQIFLYYADTWSHQKVRRQFLRENGITGGHQGCKYTLTIFKRVWDRFQKAGVTKQSVGKKKGKITDNQQNMDIVVRHFNVHLNDSIRSYSPIPWPPQIPDLNPLDYWLWGSVNAQIAAVNPRSFGDLLNAVDDVCRNISSAEVIRAVGNFRSRAEKCFQEFGGNFHHLLLLHKLYCVKWPEIIFSQSENHLSMTNFQEVIALNIISLFGKDPVFVLTGKPRKVYQLKLQIQTFHSKLIIHIIV